ERHERRPRRRSARPELPCGDRERETEAEREDVLRPGREPRCEATADRAGDRAERAVARHATDLEAHDAERIGRAARIERGEGGERPAHRDAVEAAGDAERETERDDLEHGAAPCKRPAASVRARRTRRAQTLREATNPLRIEGRSEREN